MNWFEGVVQSPEQIEVTSGGDQAEIYGRRGSSSSSLELGHPGSTSGGGFWQFLGYAV